jgi:hypothetical protein
LYLPQFSSQPAKYPLFDGAKEAESRETPISESGDVPSGGSRAMTVYDLPKR